MIRTIFPMFILLLFYCVSYIGSDAFATDAIINRDEAIMIAEKEAEKNEYDTDIMDLEVRFIDKNSFNKYLSYQRDEVAALKTKDELKGKVYWAVYFGPTIIDTHGCYSVDTTGSDICVFVDADNGEVITHIKDTNYNECCVW